MPRSICLTFAIGAAALAAAPAHAATVSITNAGTYVSYAAAAGEANALTVTDDAANFVFTDPVGVTPGPGCFDDLAADPTVALCPKAGIQYVLAGLRDLDDSADLTDITGSLYALYGEAGDDTLRGSSAGSTFLYGSGGLDTYVPTAGFEQVTYVERPGGVTASLDDQPNDPDGENIPSAIDLLEGTLGDDTLSGSGEDDRLSGSGGEDVLRGLGGNDSINGGGGDDRLEGGDDNDVFPDGEPGSDDISGGAGVDRAVERVSTYDTSSPRDVRVTLDDDPDDGGFVENDNVHTDVEDVTIATFGTAGSATLVGSDGFNVLSGNAGPDTIDGGRGADALNGFGGDDTIEAREGAPDRVDCGPGTGDVANVDQFDQVASCETVNRVDTPSPQQQQQQQPPPAVVVVGPRPEPRAQVPVPPRLLPTLRFRLTPTRDRRAPYRFRVVGGVVLPRTVSAAQGCDEGFVEVQVKRGTRTISTRRVGLKPDCGFSSTVSFADRRRLGRTGRLSTTVRFLGNDALLPRTARPVRMRAG
jgi:hypothetical protein